MPWQDLNNQYAVVVILWLSGFFIIYFVGLNLSYLTFFIIGVMNLRRYRHYVRVVDFEALLKTSLAKPISIIVPAYNEEKSILQTSKSLLTMHYPLFEVIVVNDGSSDNTLQLLIDEFDLVPRAKVYQ